MIKKKKNNGEEKTFFFLSQREQSIIDTRNQVSQCTSYRNTQHLFNEQKSNNNAIISFKQSLPSCQKIPEKKLLVVVHKNLRQPDEKKSNYALSFHPKIHESSLHKVCTVWLFTIAWPQCKTIQPKTYHKCNSTQVYLQSLKMSWMKKLMWLHD